MIVSNKNRHRRQSDYFRYVNAPIVPALSSKNEFHSDMYRQGAKSGFLMTFGKEPLPTYRSINISEVVTEHGTLDDGVALYSAEELRHLGLPLPPGIERKYKESLILAYLFNSSLCYVEQHKKNIIESFYATKNFGVFSALSDYLAETEKKKKVESFQTQFMNSHAEISSGIYEVIKISNDHGGLRLSKCRVNSQRNGTVILPLYAIGNYIDSIYRFLVKNHVVITYLEDEVERKLATTLNPKSLSKWLNTKNMNTVKQVQETWVNPFDFGEIILPDLFRQNEFVTLRVLDIKSIQKTN